MDYWDSSWLIEIILPSVLSIASPLGYLIPMLLGKKEYLFGSNSASIASVRSLWFPLLGNLGHLCENIVAFDFYLLLLFMLVMSQADCSRDNCVSKVEDAVPRKCSDWHSGSILMLRMGKVGEDQRKFIHFHAPSPKYM